MDLGVSFFPRLRTFYAESFQDGLSNTCTCTAGTSSDTSRNITARTRISPARHSDFIISGHSCRSCSDREHWRKLGEDILFAEIEKQILPDGVYFEQSTWYQRYTVDIYSHFILLRSLGANRYLNGGRKLEERLQKAFDFMMHITMPDGTTPLIGDDDGGRMLPLTTADPDDFRGSLARRRRVIRSRRSQICRRRVAVRRCFGCSGDATEPHQMRLKYRAAEPRVIDRFPRWRILRHARRVGATPITVSSSIAATSVRLRAATAMPTRSRSRLPCMAEPARRFGNIHVSRIARAARLFSFDHGPQHAGRRRLSSSEPGSTFNWKTRAKAMPKKWISPRTGSIFLRARTTDMSGSSSRQRTPAASCFSKSDYWIIRDLVETAGEHEYSLNFHYAHDVRPGISR